MGRLIDIDRLCNDLAKRWSIADKKKEDIIRAVMADVVTPIVVSQPTVDVVPVVHCRECRNWNHNVSPIQNNCILSGKLWTHCIVINAMTPEDGYCHRAEMERKDGEIH